MRLLRFLETSLVRVKNAEIIHNGSDIGMFFAEMFFINFKRVQVVGLGRFLAAGFSIDESDVIEERAEVGIEDVFHLGPSLNRFLIVDDCFLLLTEYVAEVGKTTSGTINRAKIRRLGLLKNGERLYEQRLRLGAIVLLIVKLSESFVAQRKRAMVFRKGPPRQIKRGLPYPNRFGQAITGSQGFQFVA